MPDNPDELPDDLQKFMLDLPEDDEQRLAALKRSAPFELTDLPAVEHGHVMRPLSIGTGFVVETDGGEFLRLDRLFQYRTYGGVLNGLPFDPMFNIESAIDYARSRFPDRTAPPCVLPPRLNRGHRRYKRHTGEEELEHWTLLPCCTSFGEFTASRKARNADPDSDCSSVLLIWYQDSYGLPQDEHTLRAMATLDWEAFAHSWWF